MDTRKTDCDLNYPAWHRWLLLVALLALGSLYIMAYAFFVTRSQDFIVAEQNSKAVDFSRTYALALPADLSFGPNKNNDARLGGGWNSPEENGVWTATKDAWIELTVRPPDTDLLLRLNMTTLIAKRNPRNRIKLNVNNVAMGLWPRDHSNSSAPIEVRLPRSLVDTGQLAIHIQTDRVSSPFRLKSGNDKRYLGLLLTSIQIFKGGEVGGNAPSDVRH